MTESEVGRVALRIEKEMFGLFRVTDSRYKSKYRSLMFNLKDPKNQVCLPPAGAPSAERAAPAPRGAGLLPLPDPPAGRRPLLLGVVFGAESGGPSPASAGGPGSGAREHGASVCRGSSTVFCGRTSLWQNS